MRPGFVYQNKRKHMRSLIFLFLFFVLAGQGCRQERKYATGDVPVMTDTLRHLEIVWDTAAKKISHDVYFAEYGRLRRLSGDTLMLVYQCGPKGREWNTIGIRRSFNNGDSWSDLQLLQPRRKYYDGYCNPDVLAMKNGQLLMVYAARKFRGDTSENHLQIRTSSDRGKSWTKGRTIARGHFWEPGLLSLPDGRIELFHTVEFPNRDAQGRPEQGIMMRSSMNYGQSWSDPILVSFLPGKRDGMPVPLLLNDGKGILLAIESVHHRNSPEIIWSSLKAKWNYPTHGSVENGRRWYGAVEPIWGGAPSMVQLPSGEVIIAMQTEGGRKIERYTGWKKNTMQVLVGNSMAKNFGSLSHPYPNLPVTEGAYFSSLFLKDPNTIVLVSSRNFQDGHSEIWWKEGRIKKRHQVFNPG